MTTLLKNLLLVFALFVLLNRTSAQQTNSSAPATGMFKIAILYPSGDNKTFDMDYYEKKHMPMVATLLGKNLKLYEIDKGVAGRMAGDKAPFVAVGYFYVADVAEYNKAIAANRDAVMSDIKNYTNIQPTIQISEIRQLVYNKNQ